MIHELKLSKEVAATTEEYVEFTPAAGKNILIFNFSGSGSYSVNSVIKLIWDFGGSEQLIWTIKGERPMPFKHLIPGASVDGIKKLALSLENTALGPVYLSGFAGFEEY